MNDLINRLIQNPHKLFLVDGAGAINTAIFLYFILRPYQEYFGMPPEPLIYLSVVACAFSVYSLVCYFIKIKKWQPFLRAISIANLIYCGVTTTLVICYYESLTQLGIAYFAGEIVVVCALVYVEQKALRHWQKG